MSLSFAVLSFFAGIFTIFAPCMFFFLPVVLTGSVGGKDKWRPFIISTSLAVSVFVFTMLLKVLTIFIVIPQSFWNVFSALFIGLFGITLLFPHAWEKVSVKLGFSTRSQKTFNSMTQKDGFLGLVMLGAALGPVFASCSPTYFVIIGTVLPASLGVGMVYLLLYILGLWGMLLVIGMLGQKFTKKARWATNPDGAFRRWLGGLLILVALMFAFGLDKAFEAFLIQQGFDTSGLEDVVKGIVGE